MTWATAVNISFLIIFGYQTVLKIDLVVEVEALLYLFKMALHILNGIILMLTIIFIFNHSSLMVTASTYFVLFIVLQRMTLIHLWSHLMLLYLSYLNLKLCA